MIDWISVKDCLPEEQVHKMRIVRCLSGVFYVSWRIKDKYWYSLDNVRLPLVTHWAEINLPKQED
jgi:hypothetical protein